MELFDFIKILFNKSDRKTWKEMSSYEKSRFQFMLNRFMSIKYPVNANQLNLVKTNGLGVAETWKGVATRFYGDRVPSFIYTKTNKNKKADSPVAKIPKEAIDLWCERHECGDREFNELLDLDPDGLLEELKYIAKNFNKKEKDGQQED